MKEIWKWITKIVYICLSLGYKIIGKELTEEAFENFMQFVSFGIVGVSNTIVNYLIYVGSLLLLRKFFYLPKADYYIATVIAFLLSVLWSYYWNSRMVFKLEQGEQRSWWKALLKSYISYSFTGLFLNSILLFLWVDLLHISEFIAPILNLLISVPINYMLNKFWAFSKG